MEGKKDAKCLVGSLSRMKNLILIIKHRSTGLEYVIF